MSPDRAQPTLAAERATAAGRDPGQSPPSFLRRWRLLLTVGAAITVAAIIGGTLLGMSLTGPVREVTGMRTVAAARAKELGATAPELLSPTTPATAATAGQGRFLATVRSVTGGAAGSDAALLKAGGFVCTLSNHASESDVIKVLRFADGALTKVTTGVVYRTARADLCP